MIDKDNPCQLEPGAAYVAYQICNLKGELIPGVTAELGGFDSGFGLAGGQAARLELGDLAADECRTVFWYVGYPCDEDLTSQMTIEVGDAEPGTVSQTDEIGIEKSKSTGSGAVANWMGIGTYFTEHGEICIDVQYKFKNVKEGKTVYFQPAGNIDFDANCLQLSRFYVMESDITGVPEGQGGQFHYVLPERANNTKYVYVRYYFKVNCQNFGTDIEPFATSTSGNTQLKHNPNGVRTNIDIPGDMVLPCEFVPGAEFEFFEMPSGNNWGMAWGDYDRDGHADLFVTTNDLDQPNALYRNNGDGTFILVSSGDIATDKGPSLAATWADYDNDNDLDLYVTNNIGTPNFLYRNDGGGNFVSVKDDPVVEYIGYSHGAAWADFDNDGFLDLFVATYWETEFNKLYRNNGDGTFSAVTNNPIVTEASRSVAGAWADFDGDGWQDLFVTNLENRNNCLYRNTGNGSFQKVTTGAPVTDGGWSVGASWGDYDNDGDLDLFVANASDEPNFLYQNNGDGTFTKITEGAIVTDEAHTHGSAWGDFDNDGDLDLFVANDESDNALYANNGDGTFSRRENEITDDKGLSFGTAWADIDGDGDLDLFVANRNDENNFLYINQKWDCQNFACIRLVGTNSNHSAIGAKIMLTAEIDGEEITQTRVVSAQTGGGTGGQNELAAHFGLGDADIIKEIKVLWPSGYAQTLTNEPVNQCHLIEEDKGSLITGYVYFANTVECEEGAGSVGLPEEAANAHYRTIASGNWSDASTWLNGNVPSPFQPLEGSTISIEHDVSFDYQNAGFGLQPGLKMWLTGAVLKIPHFAHYGGEFRMKNATLVSSGIVKFRNDAVFVAENSKVEIDGNFHSQTSNLQMHLKNVCLKIDGHLKNKGGYKMENVILECASIKNYGGTEWSVNKVWIKTEKGIAQYTGASTEGSGLVIWVTDANGFIRNYGTGVWTASIEQYCAQQQPSGIGGQYLPVQSDCDMEDNFGDAACSEVSAPPAVVSTGPQDERIGIPNCRVVINPGNMTVYTDENGYYSANVPLGTCHVTVHPDVNFSTVCPNEFGEREVHVSQIGTTYDDNDFGHDAHCTSPDMRVEIATTAHRVGFENLMVINYENLGGVVGTSAQLLLSLDEGIIPMEASVPWEGLSATILTWNFDKLEPGESGTIYLTYMVDAGMPLDEEVELKALLNCAEEDCDANNDTFILLARTVGGLDPNDILVSPEGGMAREEILTYKIRFQNVGNAPVSTVRIENELPEELDLATLEIGAASHTYEFRADGKKLIWTFPVINLPDSLHNEPESHGFVTYRIRPKAEVPVGQKFENGAAIYFDRLDPVITNTVSNFILAEPKKGGKPNVLQVYPNPASSFVVAQFGQPELLTGEFTLQTVEVFDPIGRLVAKQHQEEGPRMTLDLSGMAPGLYTFHGIDDLGRRFVGKVVVAAR